MGILIKFTLRNIKEHKFRTFLIILSIVLSVGLFFASFSVSDSLTGMIMGQIKSEIGTSDMIISVGENSGTGKITQRDISGINDKVAYQVGALQASSKFKGKDNKYTSVEMKAFKLSDLKDINPLVFASKAIDDSTFTGKQLIVNRSFATENNFLVGDSVKLKFGDNDFKYFKIAAVAEDKGFLKQSFFGQKSIKMIVPVDIIQKFYQLGDGYYMMYAKAVDDKKIDESIKALKTIYPKMDVQKTITKSEIDNQIKPIRMPFMFMLILVVIISIFIIYTSFKVIMMERLPMLGTFRSIGATKKMTNVLMLSESLIYGIFGSILGVLLGIQVLNLLMTVMSSMSGDIPSTVTYPPFNVGLAFAFGVLLCFFSGLIPIIKTTKIPIKEVLLNIIEGTKRKKKNLRYVFGLTMGIAAYAVPRMFTTGMTAAIAGGVGVVMVIMTMILFIPLLTDLTLIILERFLGLIFGNIGMLASKNLKGSKSTYDNIVLLTIGLTSIVAISMLSQGMEKDTMAEFTNSNYQIDVSVSQGTDTTVQRISTIEGISKITEYGSADSPFTYKKDKKFLSQAVGASSLDYFDMVKFDVLNTDQDQKIFKQVLSGRNLIISTQVRDKYKLTLNQEIELKTKAGLRTYKVIGFIQTKKGQGKFAITSISNLKNDMKAVYGKELMVQTVPGADNDKILAAINKKTEKQDGWNQTLEARKAEYKKQNGFITIILSAFSYATALIGSIGVMNNFMVSFMSRRKSLAVMTSVGMSKVQRKKMIRIEAIAAGIIGGIFGLLSGSIVLTMVSRLLGLLEVNLDLKLTVSFALIGLFGGVLVCLISSMGVVRQSAKLSVLEELKYE